MSKAVGSTKTKNHLRVFWNDGMILEPEHLYQQEAFLLGISESWARKLHPHIYGISAIEIDEDSLTKGYFALKSINGIFPDGTHFDLPDDGKLPSPIQITQDNEVVIISLAISNQINPISQLVEEEFISGAAVDRYRQREKANSDRYEPAEITVAESSGSIFEKKCVQVASLCSRLCPINEVGLDEIAIPIAKITKVSNRNCLELDDSYIPHILDLRASKFLWHEVQDLLALIRYRADWQISRLNQPQTTSALETSDFILLQVLLRTESNLRLMLAQSPALPFEIYQILLTLISELGALQYPPVRIDDLVLWTPETSADAYQQALSRLKKLLSVMRERIALEFNFKINSENIFVAQNALPQFDLRSRIIIAVHAEVPDDWFWERFNTQVTICSLDRLRDRIRLQLGGIPIKHLATTPSELPIQAGWHYFELVSMGELWYELVRSLSIGIYVSGNWPALQIRGWILQTQATQRVDI